VGKPGKNAIQILRGGNIPVMADPELKIRKSPNYDIEAIVDARMMKRPPKKDQDAGPFVIDLGPGFVVDGNCHAVIETNQGYYPGRVIWDRPAKVNTGIPGKVGENQRNRVLRAPAGGKIKIKVPIGSIIRRGSIIESVGSELIAAPFDGVLRGILREEFPVQRGKKIGDLNPGGDSRYTATISEKSLAIGDGVLEALLTHQEIRWKLWN